VTACRVPPGAVAQVGLGPGFTIAVFFTVGFALDDFVLVELALPPEDDPLPAELDVPDEAVVTEWVVEDGDDEAGGGLGARVEVEVDVDLGFAVAFGVVGVGFGFGVEAGAAGGVGEVTGAGSGAGVSSAKAHGVETTPTNATARNAMRRTGPTLK
jgi:hypothetical protein